jgi:hypothetical protein
MRRLALKGRTLQSKDLKAGCKGLKSAARRLFGSVEETARHAGVPYDTMPTCRRWDRERVVREIRRLARNKRAIREKDLTSCKGLKSAAYKLFGSCRAAVRHAGVPYETKTRRWTANWWRGISLD